MSTHSSLIQYQRTLYENQGSIAGIGIAIKNQNRLGIDTSQRNIFFACFRSTDQVMAKWIRQHTWILGSYI